MLLERKKINICIFNIQSNFIPLLHNHQELTHNCQWLADLCKSLKTRCFIVEHRAFGGKRPDDFTTAAKEATRLVTDHFDFQQETHIASYLRKYMNQQYVLAGAQSHVSILQSAIGLQKKGNTVFILADTCSSRLEMNHNYGLQRARDNGIQLITREMFFYELMRTTQEPHYHELVKHFLPHTLIKK